VAEYLRQRGSVRQRALSRNRRRNRGGLRSDLCEASIPERRTWKRKVSVARVDHIVPLSLGGDPTDPSNLQVLCPACDKEKTKGDLRALTPMDPW
jgi:5-methylcytosine-specific restriction endonuclease McrA